MPRIYVSNITTTACTDWRNVVREEDEIVDKAFSLCFLVMKRDGSDISSLHNVFTVRLDS